MVIGRNLFRGGEWSPGWMSVRNGNDRSPGFTRGYGSAALRAGVVELAACAFRLGVSTNHSLFSRPAGGRLGEEGRGDEGFRRLGHRPIYHRKLAEDHGSKIDGV